MKLPILSFCLFCHAFLQAQFVIPEKPKNDYTLVYDYANILSDEEEKQLDAKLFPYEKSTSTQIVVAIVKSLNDEDINMVGAKWGEKWGIGQASKDNGVIILVAIDDRKIAIQNGKGSEVKIIDARSKQIIDYVIIPKFRQSQYYEGLSEAIDAIIEVMSDEYKADETDYEGGNADTSLNWITILIIVVIVIVFFIILYVSSKNKNNRNDDDYDDGDIIFTDYGRRSWKRNSGDGWIFGSGSGGFGGGSSIGGFGGFGGGSFGGGGASGSW